MTATDISRHPALAGLTVLERGWLSSNNVLIHAAGDEPGAVLVDTGHVNHAVQTLALVRHALGAAPLARVVNTHLHSDHCGGNATLQRELGVPVFVPPGQAQAVQAWDEQALSYAATGQRCERFVVDGVVQPGETVTAGGRNWQVLQAPGHDPASVMFFDAAHGVLISADALWEHGFGVVFPEIAGEPGFGDVAQVLDDIEALPVRVVIPGHGAPFTDVTGALARARSRLEAFVADPTRHARHGAKVLVKYHLMEEHEQTLEALRAWGEATPLMHGLWERVGRRDAGSAGEWAQRLAQELAASGAVRVRGAVVQNV